MFLLVPLEDGLEGGEGRSGKWVSLNGLGPLLSWRENTRTLAFAGSGRRDSSRVLNTWASRSFFVLFTGLLVRVDKKNELPKKKMKKRKRKKKKKKKEAHSLPHQHISFQIERNFRVCYNECLIKSPTYRDFEPLQV